MVILPRTPSFPNEDPLPVAEHNPYTAPAVSGADTVSMPTDVAEVVSQFLFTPEHLLQTLARYRQARGGLRFWSRLRLLLGCGGLLAAVSFFSIGEVTPGLLMLVCGVVLLLTGRLNNYFVIRAFRSSPHFQTEQTLRLSATGFATESPIEQTNAQWSAFTEAVFFEDGVLLYRGKHIINWVPDRSLTTGTPATLRSVISAQLPNKFV